MMPAVIDKTALTENNTLHTLEAVRRQSLALCQTLTPEDMMVQSCPEASPAKWHLAHTSWFFETFILRDFSPGYCAFHADFLWLFNSYYNSVSSQPQKKLRASFSRPGLEQILEYRAYVDEALRAMFTMEQPQEATRRLILGLHHEQQHGELLLTDIKHALWSNPLHPAYRVGPLAAASQSGVRPAFTHFDEGLKEIGFGGEGFCFDNEQPRHRVWLDAFGLATRPVNCADFLAFMQDDGYARSDLWLSDGWDAVQREQWEAPLYWHRPDGSGSGSEDWTVFTLRGDAPLEALLAAPVCHVSYFEADAFARWAGKRLPTEEEWEMAAGTLEPQPEHMLEGDALHPLATNEQGLQGMFGGVWEWTASAYLGYPGYAAVPGALGEYNGKFMSNKMILRGGSVATPLTHIRSTYRNFFPPETRWQFSGARLATR
jgi:ergothioneine biosynthesis protein EgtB